MKLKMFLLVVLLGFSGCVSTGEFRKLQSDYQVKKDADNKNNELIVKAVNYVISKCDELEKQVKKHKKAAK